ncbi:uncharacterized protein [Physcomitrium patens]|uniref:RRM domain-containing protein n=1 Tax=Physcomitrium patens TaxID=3218 RepID=A0A2K1KB25_PHYPA|nr:multiple RNA-binding domain-containing protein 1-like [Physcomitrium patens]PNR50980.1 hypothetical protein PHYPA_010166 [Physcomitrium patens]|eukprot:XP_024381120.1 multiple RNA-binding domain-containing protein 1-like [Physcomitrella patens]
MASTGSSRICVKNLPRHVTEERLREHFAAKGEVTDAKIIRTRDGRTRQFGFVGYRTEEEAKDAAKYFHRSFFDTSRLTCELAQAVGDPNLPRPWSRHSEGSSKFKPKSDDVVENPTTSAKDTGKFKKNQDFRSKTADSELENDPQLQEFLEVMQPRSKSKLWANDTKIASNGSDSASKHGKQKQGSKKEKKASVEMKTVETFSRRVPINKGKGVEKLTQMHVRFDDSDSEESDEDELYEEAPVLDNTESREGAADKEDVDEDGVNPIQDPVLKDETLTDLDYLKSRTKSGAWSDDDDDDDASDKDAALDDANDLTTSSKEDDDEDGEEEDESEVEDEEMNDAADNVVIAEIDRDDGKNGLDHIEQSAEGDAHVAPVLAEEQESVSETGRLFVRNLPYTATEEELAELFGKFGELSEVHLVLDKTTKRSKAMAFVLYMIPECAVRAMEQLDKSIFQGRLIHILPARRPPPPPETEKTTSMGPGSTKFKQEKESQRKAAELSGNTKAWNPLFMRPDTIAENVARQYNMTKSEFLDPNADDLAVRMALGETHIIAETKRALSDEGVNVEVLEDVASGKEIKVTRSSTVILVKNLPFSTTEDELVSMFGVFGSIARVILPPTKTLALVEYLEAAEARRAFKGLAYKRFKHVPLYLEWAPVNLLTGVKKSRVFTGAEKTKGAVGDKLLQRVAVETQVAALTEDDDVDQARSLFVKNLNFSTTEVSLKKHFDQKITQGSVRSVTIKKKQSKSGKPLSMGFGFIEFDSVDTAKMVCQNLQGTVLEGHALILQLSHNSKKACGSDSKTSATKGKAESKESSTKIIVRNVAFEATRKDLQQIFNPFGQIKSIRLPKKFDGNHRGFAFVEFLTKKEAQNAFEALQNTHLYGRHMVLERAKEGESLEELRARTASQFSEANNDGRAAKRRKQAEMDDSQMSFGRFTE